MERKRKTRERERDIGLPNRTIHNHRKVHHFPTKISQEYTPVSSAATWEDGRLELLVKTYPDGCVSRFFGTLRTVPEAQEAQLQSYAPLEEQILFGEHRGWVG